jgi:ribosomal protein L7Ae-like RNA K-turn-binding protein
MCRKSGNLVLGFDASRDCVLDGKAFCIIAAQDISPNTLRKMQTICEMFSARKVPVVQIDLTVREMEKYLCQKVAVAAVCDKGFSERFQELVIYASGKIGIGI